nr:hypothetical protein [Tanacetum cinerariifolium]
MATTIEQQVALDEALVPSTQRCPFFKAFLVTADVPEIYMQEFWATTYVHQHSIKFKLDNKKHIVNLETFRDMLHICPRIPGQPFLGHSAQIRTLTDVNINKLFQPWRSFGAVINKCLTGKSSGFDSFRLSQAQILWGLYHSRNIDYAFLIWEDFMYQVEHKNHKKSNKMYYPRFTKVVYDVLRLTPFYKAFLVIADLPEIYMQEFWATATLYHHSIHFKMNNKKRIVNLECFREMLHICPRIPNQTFDELLFEEEILAFLRYLGHNKEIKKIMDVWILLLSQAQILWGMYHKKNVDFAYPLWEDFVYQVEHKDAKKSNEMYYPRFIKVIINFFMTKDPSIPRRNKMNWHCVRDDQMFTTIKLVSRHQNTQQFGAMFPIELRNEDIRNSASYKEYYAIASGAAPPKTKASVRKMQSSFDTRMPPPTATSTRLSTSAKGKQPVKSSKAKGLSVLSEVALTKAQQIKLATKRSLQQTYISQASRSDNNGDDFIHPKLSTHDEEAKDKESFDPIVQTPSQVENSDDERNNEESHGMNVEGDKGPDAEELYRDININLEGRDVQMTDVHTTQVLEDTHVTLTPVNPDGQQQSSSVSSQFVTSMFNPSPDVGIDSLFESTPRVDVPLTTTVVPLLVTAPTLPPPFIPIMSEFAEAVSSIPGIVDRYIDYRMNEAVKVAVQLQSDRFRDEAQAENKDFINKLDENIQKIIKKQVKTSYVVAADLSELELKKILIEKMESNKSIHQSDEQRNLYKALVDAYECDKIILDIYGDIVTLKRRRDDADKDEEPSARSDRGSKRRRE